MAGHRNPLQFSLQQSGVGHTWAYPPPQSAGPISYALRENRPVSSAQSTTETHAALGVCPFLGEPSLCAKLELTA